MELLYGKSPILEALRAEKRSIRKFYHVGAASDRAFGEAMEICSRKKIPIQEVSKPWLNDKLPGVLTQGWVAESSPYPYEDFGSVLKNLRAKNDAILLALDQIQDPQNLGAMLRTAECVGVEGVLIPEDRSVGITPAVCKAAAGAEEYLPVCKVTNLARALKAAKDAGFWVVGTTLPSETSASPNVQNALSFDWPAKTLLVLGSEGEGMRRLTEKLCDFLIHLPLAGKISSLNVAATAAVCLFEMVRKKRI